MAYVIAEPCIDVKDGACTHVCPVDCIQTSDESRQYFIDPSRCIACRACELYCPVNAIFSTWDLPAKWRASEAVNASFFVR
ncbi:MAG: 4Fe-4S ferredoxin [Anaerolinea sp.]|nr:4Fe-4S ferredoxin [Anaerolinea sp.]